ncbi:MAG: tRNA epoxyqueuosine(34) reductase QueG [Spirochaetales bacterium]|nr:tRNA epoxyqueuosine(34) reductase QueG [Leptospiraceae bacterium]MCP5480461.1 tRNA epoxyqueuosine(34) reductase QueG [Spirochaetales bacterium]
MKEWLRDLSFEAGFDLFGCASLVLPPEDQKNLEAFGKGPLGDMRWFLDTLELRINPARILPGARSAVVLGIYYRDRESEEFHSSAAVRVSRYAVGRDYHRVLRKKGKELAVRMQQRWPQAKARLVVDSAPVPEKILGREAGLGWIGKNTNLIHPQWGSYFFLAVLLTSLDLPPDTPQPDLCASCRLCLDACPTDALQPYQIDPTRCISYLTIEDRSRLHPELDERRAGWAFGCDVCQEVCPYNRNRGARKGDTKEADFRLRPAVRNLMETGTLDGVEQWELLSQGSPLRRAGFERLKENLRLARLGPKP